MNPLTHVYACILSMSIKKEIIGKMPVREEMPVTEVAINFLIMLI